MYKVSWHNVMWVLKFYRKQSKLLFLCLSHAKANSKVSYCALVCVCTCSLWQLDVQCTFPGKWYAFAWFQFIFSLPMEHMFVYNVGFILSGAPHLVVCVCYLMHPYQYMYIQLMDCAAGLCSRSSIFPWWCINCVCGLCMSIVDVHPEISLMYGEVAQW